MRLCSRMLFVLFGVFLVSSGCIFDPHRSEGPEQDPFATPEGVLGELRTAYVLKDIDRYLEALADTFVFHIMPRDFDVFPNPTLGKTEEEQIHRIMFEEAHSIELVMAGESATKIGDEPETWSLYREYDIIVWFTETEMSEFSPAYGWAEFVLAKGDDDKFRIVDWYDLEQEP